MTKKINHKPRYRAIAAVTIDGRIARDNRHLTNWTSSEDKDFLHKMLDAGDVIIVGRNTYLIAYKQLSQRNCIVFTKTALKKQPSPNCLYINPETTDFLGVIQERGYKIINVLGGAAVYGWFLQKNLLDDIYLTIEPLIFGSGLPLFNIKLNMTVHYKLHSVKKLNSSGSVLLHYIKSSR